MGIALTFTPISWHKMFSYWGNANPAGRSAPPPCTNRVKPLANNVDLKQHHNLELSINISIYLPPLPLLPFTPFTPLPLALRKFRIMYRPYVHNRTPSRENVRIPSSSRPVFNTSMSITDSFELLWFHVLRSCSCVQCTQ